MSGEEHDLLTHPDTRKFDEVNHLKRIETIKFNDGNEYLIGTPFSEMIYYLENEYFDDIIENLKENLKEELKKELKDELLNEIKEELKKENNNH
jgi:hypothetical protein